MIHDEVALGEAIRLQRNFNLLFEELILLAMDEAPTPRRLKDTRRGAKLLREQMIDIETELTEVIDALPTKGDWRCNHCDTPLPGEAPTEEDENCVGFAQRYLHCDACDTPLTCHVMFFGNGKRRVMVSID